MSAPAPVPQLHALTGLRGIAAWLVVFYHARLTLVGWVPAPVIGWAGQGYLAVDLFFMLSGFVLWLNYGARLRASGLAGAPQFWWRRFARIWPLHGAIMAALVAFAMLLLATGRDTTNYPLAELPLHLLLVQNWGLTGDLSWNHPAWSISAEVGAYLLFPFAVLAVPWERLPALALVALGGALVLGLHLVFALAGEPSLGGQIARLGLLRCLFEFAIGMVLANLWQAWKTHRGTSVACVIVGAALLAAGVELGAPQTLSVPTVFAVLLLALALDHGPLARLLASGPLRWLGDVSYATYLVHFPLFIVAKMVLVGDDLRLGPSGFAAYLAVLLALSGALYRWLEKPTQRALNRAWPIASRQGAHLPG